MPAGAVRHGQPRGRCAGAPRGRAARLMHGTGRLHATTGLGTGQGAARRAAGCGWRLRGSDSPSSALEGGSGDLQPQAVAEAGPGTRQARSPPLQPATATVINPQLERRRDDPTAPCSG